jgi:hypothetical protein
MNKIWLRLALYGILLAAIGVMPSFAKEVKEKIPKGLKTKTEAKYEFVEKFGKYEKVLESKCILKYDDKGNRIEVADYDADGKLTGKFLSKYDDRGNQIEVADYDADGKLRRNFLYKYDDRGNQIERAFYGAVGKLIGKDLYKYDDKGNEIERAIYDAAGKLTRKTLSKHKYDNRGNQIEEINYEIVERFGKAEEVPQSQTVWEYEFYP